MDYPGGPSIITRLLISQRVKQKSPKGVVTMDTEVRAMLSSVLKVKGHHEAMAGSI